MRKQRAPTRGEVHAFINHKYELFKLAKDYIRFYIKKRFFAVRECVVASKVGALLC